MKHIISAEFKHETNRYSPGLTDRRIYEDRYALIGEESIRSAYKNVKNEMGGFIDYFSDKNDVRFEPVLAFNAQPGPAVANDVWEFVKDCLLEKLRQASRVDGVLLALHGAMVTQFSEDGEGDLLEQIRQVVGSDIPVITTLDLHANVTEKMVHYADAYFPYDYYPHTDLYEAGCRAADCMYRTLLGEIKPVLAWSKLDMIMPYIPTDHPAMRPFVEKTMAMRNCDKIINANLCHGFFAADIYEQGSAVLVTTDNDFELAKRTAQDLADEVFANRYLLQRKYMTADEALAAAQQAKVKPVTIADVADNPGSGATCDATSLLRYLLDKKVQNAAVAVIYDPQTVTEAEKAGVGNMVHIQLGGKLAPEITGGPIECDAYVRSVIDGVTRNREGCSKGLITNYGKCALLNINGIYVIVCSIRVQPWGLEIYRCCGIQPQDMDILVVKSAVQFRASFETVSQTILDVELPALGPQNPTMLPLAHSRRPIFPLDQ